MNIEGKMEKLRSYQGFSGQFSEWKSNARAKYDNWKEDHAGESLVDIGANLTKKSTGHESENDYSHIYRSANEQFHSDIMNFVLLNIQIYY